MGYTLVAVRFYGVQLETYLEGQRKNGSIEENQSGDEFYRHEDWLEKYLKNHNQDYYPQ